MVPEMTPLEHLTSVQNFDVDALKRLLGFSSEAQQKPKIQDVCTASCEYCEYCTQKSDFGSPKTAESRGKTGFPRLPQNESKIRSQRWEVLGSLWGVSTLPRVRTCGRWSHVPHGRVGVRKNAQTVGYSGLISCGSVWACPRCSAKIMAVRRLELGVLIARARAQGMTIAFGTVTLRHRRGQPLARLWEAVSNGGRAVTNSSRVKRLRQELGRVGYVRAFEVTHGGNGWHPHIHTIQLFSEDVSQAQLDTLRDAEFAIWERQALKRGLGRPLKKCYELRKVTNADTAFSDYFAKAVYNPSAQAVAFEMTGSQTKRGRERARTPWQILADFHKTGDAQDLELWHEYERASFRKNALVWSRGLKQMFDIGEIDDETIASQDVHGDTLFVVTDWSPIAAKSRLGGELLGAVAMGGLSAGLHFCMSHGIPVEINTNVRLLL